jgi:hypothetical protein
MLTPDERRAMIAQLRAFPDQFAALVQPLSPEQRTARPLPGEWSVAQNIHHLADSHMNAYIRFKLILLENHPTIKPYNQEDWAETADATPADVDDSLAILRGLHLRWTAVMESIDEAQWARAGLHPEVGEITLEWLLIHYIEHSAGHIDQMQRTIKALR